MALDSRQEVHTKKRRDCTVVSFSDLLCVFTLFIFLDSWDSAAVADLRCQSLPGCRLTRETERRSRTEGGPYC